MVSQRLAHLVLILALSSFVPTGVAGVSTPALGYGGRLTDASGAPLVGPVDLAVNFFTAPTGGAALTPSPVTFAATPLTNGVFQLTLPLSPAQMNALFGDGAQAVYVEVTDTTHGKTYPRQQLLAVPYAARVPVDGSNLVFNADGQLTLGPAAKSGGAATPPTMSVGTSANDLVQLDGAAKLPALDGSRLTGVVAASVAGTVAAGNGGTGLTATPASGQLAIGNGAGYTLATLSQGATAGVTVTNGAGSIKLDTAQDIRTTATPTFTGLALGGGTLSAGFLGIGTTTPGTELDVAGVLTVRGVTPPAVAPVLQGRLYFDASAGKFLVSQNGGGYTPLATGGTVTTITAGTGLAGGTISGSGTLSLGTVGTAATYTKVTTDAYGRVTGGTSLAASDLPNLSASQITGGTLSVALGGTGSGNWPNNALLVGGGTTITVLSPGAAGNVLVGAVAGAPSWGQLNLGAAAAVTGTLAVANGGTGATTTTGALTALGAAASGANADITALSGLTTALPVSEGGTGASTLTANSVLLGNGTSAPQAVAAGSSGNVLTSNGTTWLSQAVPATNWGSPGAIGSVSPGTGAFTTLTTTGNVGIGTPSPRSMLDVAGGSMYSRSLDNGSGTAIDWSKSNAQITSTNTAALTFINMQDGGAYTLVCTGATSVKHTFSQSSLTFLFVPPNAATAPSTPTVYSFVRVGATVYVSWLSGFQ